MTLRQIIRTLLSRRRPVLAIALAVGVVAFLVVNAQPRLYAGKARLMIGADQQGASSDAQRQRMAKTYAELATSYPVLAAAADELRLPLAPHDLAWRVSAEPIPATNLLDLVVVAESPERAAALANSLAEQLIRQSPSGLQGVEGGLQQEIQQQIAEVKVQIADADAEIAALEQQIAGADDTQRASLQVRRDMLQGRVGEWQATLASLYETYRRSSAGAPTLIERALINQQPVAPHPWRAALLSTLAALLLAPGLLLLIERRYFTVRRPEDLSAETTGPLLGAIPPVGNQGAATRTIDDLSSFNAADSYESLRINLQMRSRDPLRMVAVSEVERGDRAHAIAAQLALATARLGTRVVLVDADLANPRLHTLLHLSNRSGLSTMLHEDDDEQLRRGIIDFEDNLQVIPAGPPSGEPAKLLADERLRLLLWVLRQEADLLIVVVPPDQHSLALLQEADGALLVAEYGRTPRRALRQAYRRLRSGEVQVLGVALDRVDPRAYPSFAVGKQRRSVWERLRPGRRVRARDPYAALVERRYALVRIPINLTLIAGCCMMLYGGGLYADAAYEQHAARGDNDLPAAAVEVLLPSEPDAFVIPLLNAPIKPAVASEQPEASKRSTISRLIIPRIGVDTKVIEVMRQLVDTGGQQVLVWQVAKYAVGHHEGSANPGEGDNIVLAGHVGGAAPVFKDLIMLEPGDQLTLFSQGRQYVYVVSEKTVVQEIGMPVEVRRANARFMDPTSEELVTLITCWPPTGPERYNYRVIVRATPYALQQTPTERDQTNWGIR